MSVIEEIKKALRTLSVTTTVQLLWTPGHAGLHGNEAVDGLAKEGTKEAVAMPEDSRTTTLQEVKGSS